jgi:hypothetical protein
MLKMGRGRESSLVVPTADGMKERAPSTEGLDPSSFEHIQSLKASMMETLGHNYYDMLDSDSIDLSWVSNESLDLDSGMLD